MSSKEKVRNITLDEFIAKELNKLPQSLYKDKEKKKSQKKVSKEYNTINLQKKIKQLLKDIDHWPKTKGERRQRYAKRTAMQREDENRLFDKRKRDRENEHPTITLTGSRPIVRSSYGLSTWRKHLRFGNKTAKNQRKKKKQITHKRK